MATRLNAAFRAQPNATVSFVATSPVASLQLGGAATEYRVFNAGPNTAFIELGASTLVATVGNSMPIVSGAIEFFRPPATVTDAYLSAISAGTSTLYITPGEGV